MLPWQAVAAHEPAPWSTSERTAGPPAGTVERAPRSSGVTPDPTPCHVATRSRTVAPQPTQCRTFMTILVQRDEKKTPDGPAEGRRPPSALTTVFNDYSRRNACGSKGFILN